MADVESILKRGVLKQLEAELLEVKVFYAGIDDDEGYRAELKLYNEMIRKIQRTRPADAYYPILEPLFDENPEKAWSFLLDAITFGLGEK